MWPKKQFSPKINAYTTIDRTPLTFLWLDTQIIINLSIVFFLSHRPLIFQKKSLARAENPQKRLYSEPNTTASHVLHVLMHHVWHSNTPHNAEVNSRCLTFGFLPQLSNSIEMNRLPSWRPGFWTSWPALSTKWGRFLVHCWSCLLLQYFLMQHH